MKYNFFSGKIISAALLIGFFSSCLEKGPMIDKGVKLTDTTYMTTVPSADPKVVLIEEFTGAKCVNCPKGHEVIASLIAENPNRIASIAYHKFGTTLDEPAHLGKAGFDSLKEDFRRQEAYELMQAMFGNVTSIPMAAFDRVITGNDRVYVRTKWAGLTQTQLSQPSGLNLEAKLEVSEDKANGQLHIKGVYTKSVSDPQVINVMLVESKLVAAQYFPDSVMENYTHNHVFRKTYTGATGKPILTAVDKIEPGRAFEINMELPLEQLWKLENSYLVIFVNNNSATNKEVQQALEMKIGG